MQKEIHPQYHEIKVIQTDGSEITMKSCWGKPGDTMRLDIDDLNHPAYTGGPAKVLQKGRMAQFSNKYAGFGVASTGQEDEEETKKEASK